MKKIIAATLVAVSSLAMAEAPVLEMANTNAMCGNTKEMADYSTNTQNREIILISHEAKIVDGSGDLVTGTMTVWRRSQDGNFGIMFTVPNSGTTCLIGEGEGIDLYSGSSN